MALRPNLLLTVYRNTLYYNYYIPHLVLLDVDGLGAGVEHPVELEAGLGRSLHPAHHRGLGIEAHLVPHHGLLGADRLV